MHLSARIDFESFISLVIIVVPDFDLDTRLGFLSRSLLEGGLLLCCELMIPSSMVLDTRFTAILKNDRVDISSVDGPHTSHTRICLCSIV